MNKKEYNKALKDPKWISKRDKIKSRDGHKCTKCGSKKSLQVHHTYYLIRKMPWEVPDSCLVTLCGVCHEKEHEGRDIVTFMRHNPPKPTRKEKRKNKSKPKAKTPKVNNTPQKPKKITEYLYVAVKSKSGSKVFSQLGEWRQYMTEVCGTVKGFNDRNLADHWLRQGVAGKAKKSNRKKKK